MNEKLEFLEIVPKKVSSIFIFLHGYGSDNSDMLSLAMTMRDLLPHTAILSVNAPWQCEIGQGYQWFSLKNMNMFSMLKEIKTSRTLLDNLIDEQLKKFSLKDENLVLVGFSQGAIMSLFTGLRRTEELMGIMSFSGMMSDTAETLKKELKSKPHTLLVHGTMDNVVPFDSLGKAEKLLKLFDVPHETHAITGMGHTIDDGALYFGREFIKELFNKID